MPRTCAAAPLRAAARRTVIAAALLVTAACASAPEAPEGAPPPAAAASARHADPPNPGPPNPGPPNPGLPNPGLPNPGLIDAASLVPGLVVDMRYAGAANFVGRPIAGYDAPVCLLTRAAASALARVQQTLAPFGLGLKVFDCYRPQRAVADFVRWARDPTDQIRKGEHYPNVDKSALFALGYIAERSGHSRGATVDLTLVDLASAAELDMGSGYDVFDPISWPAAPGLAGPQRAHRLLLRSAMQSAGFRPYDKEWWHFTLVGEPFPDTYFDVPVSVGSPALLDAPH